MTDEEELKLMAEARLRAKSNADPNDMSRESPVTVLEPVLKLATGAVGKFAGDVAGLGSGAMDWMFNRTGGRNASEVQRDVQKAMTYEPRTKLGKDPRNPLNFVPEAVGSGLGWAGDKAADFAARNLPGDPADPSSTAGWVSNGVREAVPQAAGIAGMKYGGPGMARAGQALQDAGQWTMGKALGGTATAARTGDTAHASRLLLDRGLNPTEHGVNALRAEVGGLDDMVANIVRQSNETMPVGEVTDALRHTRRRFGTQVDPAADVATIDAFTQRFPQNPSIQMGEIPMGLAHDMKRGTYRTLGDKYGQLGSADVEAQKSAAAALRKGVADRVPGVEDLLSRESDLMRGLDVVERRAFADLAKNPSLVSMFIHDPATKAVYLGSKSTLFKSGVARLMNAMGQSLEGAGNALTVP